MAALYSPFCTPAADVAALQEVRSVPTAQDASNCFCPDHQQCSSDAQSTWLLHRDILHALVSPVVQLFTRASRLAEAAVCSSKPEDLEMAFTGDARSAFLWLQCFLSDEEQWCQFVGCPACIVSHTLSTEEHLRFTYTALHLANDSDMQNSNALPAIPFFTAALTDAINTDPFWDSYPGAASSIESSAESLTVNVRALRIQCGELEALVADFTEGQSTPRVQTPGTPIVSRLSTKVHGGQLPAVKTSKLAKRQQRMRLEEQAALQKLVAQCCGRAALQRNAAGPRERTHIRAIMRENGDAPHLGLASKRRRSLTCP
ncbi:uncharacterized protein K452DRAFT_360512 [Aplosporella prunicola CBS 121167]|uniref:Uncharacterized protein n=1 Tax=Aplosporella prunicola CBS 121167 TaxID=1176127 RepID=A0A6A6B5W0_9PEZI|nr:uncharacterized protein K452DRAFT_360512 [Aplosporella prunicola CBS 121167]KAF2139246.1 hypothetical protein K452DRAFT_360512 [Aplosporella prunicola CBS 121167]